MKTEIKFFQNYIQTKQENNVKKYSAAMWLNHDESEITVFSDSYDKGYFGEELREIFEVKNDSDSMTDYFEKTTFKIKKESEHFEAAKKAIELKKISYQKRIQKAKEKKMKISGAVA